MDKQTMEERFDMYVGKVLGKNFDKENHKDEMICLTENAKKFFIYELTLLIAEIVEKKTEAELGFECVAVEDIQAIAKEWGIEM